MSATRFRKPVSRHAEAPTGDVPAAHSSERWWRLAAAVLAAGAWSAALFMMAVWTSNPRLVSRDQVMASDAVIVGRLVRPGDTLVSIERVISGNLAEGDELRIVNLAEVPAMADGRRHAIPVSAYRNDFVVTTLDGQKAPPLVYDASPETIDQIEAILRDHL